MGTKANPGKHDCYEKAAIDEPIFTLRANDPIAPDVVCNWARRARNAGVSREKIEEAYGIAYAMEVWYNAHNSIPYNADALGPKE